MTVGKITAILHITITHDKNKILNSSSIEELLYVSN